MLSGHFAHGVDDLFVVHKEAGHLLHVHDVHQLVQINQSCPNVRNWSSKHCRSMRARDEPRCQHVPARGRLVDLAQGPSLFHQSTSRFEPARIVGSKLQSLVSRRSSRLCVVLEADAVPEKLRVRHAGQSRMASAHGRNDLASLHSQRLLYRHSPVVRRIVAGVHLCSPAQNPHPRSFFALIARGFVFVHFPPDRFST